MLHGRGWSIWCTAWTILFGAAGVFFLAKNKTGESFGCLALCLTYSHFVDHAGEKP